MNDTFQLVGRDGALHSLRLWRAGWRTFDEIRYEMDAVVCCARGGVRVAEPVARRDGALAGVIDAPEGPRGVAVTAWAVGSSASESDWRGVARGFGVDAARMHEATADFVSVYERFALDSTHLIDAPLSALNRTLRHRPDDWRYLSAIGARLRARVGELAPSLEWGFCHGDLHGGNAHVDEAGRLTHFDFDCCGPGWRAYDIAVHHWAARDKPECWQLFVDGYRSVRELREADVLAIPVFVAARWIWFLGTLAENADDVGASLLSDPMLDYFVGALRRWERAHLGAASLD